MDPTMLSAIAAQQVADYLDELSQERARHKRRRTGRRLPRPTLRPAWLRLPRRPVEARPSPAPAAPSAPVRTTTGACPDGR